MFEGVRIRAAAVTAVDRLSLSKDDRDLLVYAVSNSLMFPAAKGGLKQGFLESPAVATAYLLADLIQATRQEDDDTNRHIAAIAEQAAYSAMNIAGASKEESKEVIDACIELHGRSIRNLPITAKITKRHN